MQVWRIIEIADRVEKQADNNDSEDRVNRTEEHRNRTERAGHRVAVTVADSIVEKRPCIPRRVQNVDRPVRCRSNQTDANRFCVAIVLEIRKSLLLVRMEKRAMEKAFFQR